MGYQLLAFRLGKDKPEGYLVSCPEFGLATRTMAVLKRVKLII